MQQRGCNTWEGGICAMCQGMIKRGERIPYFETKSGCTPEKWWVGKWYFPKRPFLRVVGVSFREGIYSNKSRVRCVRGGQLMKDMIFPYSWDMNTHTHTHTHTCIYIYIYTCMRTSSKTDHQLLDDDHDVFKGLVMVAGPFHGTFNVQLKQPKIQEWCTTLPKFNSSPLKKVTFPIGKDHLPTIIFRGWAMLNCLGYDVVV